MAETLIEQAPATAAEQRRAGRFTRLITVLVSSAFAGNGSTLAAVSFALPGIGREWGLAPAQLGLFAAVLAAGQLVGALVVGWLADRLGRRQVFAGTIALMSLSTALAGLAPTPAAVLAMVCVAGMGFGGVSPVAISVLGELAPPRVRGQLMAWTQVFWAVGWCLTGIGAAVLTATLGWRFVLALGGLPVVLAVVAWKLAPESPRFLLAQGRREEAEALVRDLEARYGVKLPLPRQQRADPRGNPLRSLLELLGPALRRRTLTIWLTWAIMMACFNGPIILLPMILTSAGGNEVLAARTSLIVGLMMLPGIVLSMLLIERVGRRTLLMVSLAIGALGNFGLAVANSQLAIILTGGALAGGILAAWPVVMGYCAELYPTRMRATAAGWASAVGRIGSIGAPLLLGAVMSLPGGGAGLALAIFGALLLGAISLVAVAGEETGGRTLEELSG